MKDLNRYRGCLIGGAAGDALGYAIEFSGIDSIHRQYGPRGITEYRLDGGLARVSDDTQMTLFTANGLLNAATQGADSVEAIGLAYRDWYQTQRGGAESCIKHHCWLMNFSELHVPRAPGMSCMSALSKATLGTLEQPINDSKGCGGVMRVAPVGLFLDEATPAEEIQKLGARTAALTHGHALGWLSSAAMAHIVHQLAHGLADTVEAAAEEAMRVLPLAFPDAGHVDDMLRLMERALELAHDDRADLDCVAELGEGWVGEEALAISLYCAVRHEDDFDAALIASVNHSGDSDSTGAVCGNMLGAKLGLSDIPEKYQNKLELREVVLTIADDLFDYPTHVASTAADDSWTAKYVDASYAPDSIQH